MVTGCFSQEWLLVGEPQPGSTLGMGNGPASDGAPGGPATGGPGGTV